MVWYVFNNHSSARQAKTIRGLKDATHVERVATSCPGKALFDTFYPTCQEQSPRTHQNQQPRPAILQTGETGPLSVKELSVFQDGLVTMTRLLCLPPTAHPAPQTRPSWHACHSSFPKNLPSMICGHTRRQEEAMPSAGSNRTRQGEKCFYFCRWKSPGMTASKILLFLGLLWSYLLIRAVLVPSV